MKKRNLHGVLLAVFFGLICANDAFAFEIFAKGSVSKTYTAADSYVTRISATTGLAFEIIPQVRIEGRYTNISSLQNKYEIRNEGTVTDQKVQTSVFSLGVDISILGSRNAFQPFIFVGGGYVKTETSYTFTPLGTTVGTLYDDLPEQKGFTGNLGLGFRLRIVRALAFEVELFAYTKDFDSSNPLVNLYGTAGIRIYI